MDRTMEPTPRSTSSDLYREDLAIDWVCDRHGLDDKKRQELLDEAYVLTEKWSKPLNFREFFGELPPIVQP